MNKKGQIDPEVFQSPMFVILAGGTLAMTLLGYVFSKKIGTAFPLWQLAILLVVEVGACYFFAAKEQ